MADVSLLPVLMTGDTQRKLKEMLHCKVYVKPKAGHRLSDFLKPQVAGKKIA